MASFLALVDKWTAIAESVDNAPEAMAAKMYDEIWSKVDYTTYGL